MFRETELPLDLDGGRYRLLRTIGSGGMAMVYEAEVDLDRFNYAMAIATGEVDRAVAYDRRVAAIKRRYKKLKQHDQAKLRAYCDRKGLAYPRDGRAAIKVLLPNQTKHQRRFHDEWQMLAACSGPRLMPVFGGGVDSTHEASYYAMRLLDDVLSLEQVVRLRESHKLRLAAQACVAIGDLHAQGIVHRDVKPHNLICYRADGSFDLVLSDLGIARDLTRGDSGLTQEGQVLGSLCYMPPEQAGGLSDADETSDVYSLGATLYHWFGKRAPYQGLSQQDQMKRLIKGRPPVPLDDLVSDIDPDVAALVEAMMDPDPGRRPALEEVAERVAALRGVNVYEPAPHEILADEDEDADERTTEPAPHEIVDEPPRARSARPARGRPRGRRVVDEEDEGSQMAWIGGLAAGMVVLLTIVTLALRGGPSDVGDVVADGERPGTNRPAARSDRPDRNRPARNAPAAGSEQQLAPPARRDRLSERDRERLETLLRLDQFGDAEKHFATIEGDYDATALARARDLIERRRIGLAVLKRDPETYLERLADLEKSGRVTAAQGRELRAHFEAEVEKRKGRAAAEERQRRLWKAKEKYEVTRTRIAMRAFEEARATIEDIPEEVGDFRARAQKALDEGIDAYLVLVSAEAERQFRARQFARAANLAFVALRVCRTHAQRARWHDHLDRYRGRPVATLAKIVEGADRGLRSASARRAFLDALRTSRGRIGSFHSGADLLDRLIDEYARAPIGSAVEAAWTRRIAEHAYRVRGEDVIAGEDCPDCSAGGRVDCPDCRDGHTFGECPVCKGDKRVVCDACRGLGQHRCTACTRGCGECLASRWKPCQRCQREKALTCGHCAGKGTGKLACRSCLGASKAHCARCAGLGRIRTPVGRLPEMPKPTGRPFSIHLDQPVAAKSALSRRLDRGWRKKREALWGPRKGDVALARMNALVWLSRHQDADGKWDAAGFMRHDPAHDVCKGAARLTYADPGVTSMALMAFLAGGYTQSHGRFATTVRRGLAYLVQLQRADGRISGSDPRPVQTHLLATLALVEAYGMTGDARLRDPARRALGWLKGAQNPAMAWRYGHRDGDNDMPTSAGAIEAVRAGERAGLIDVDTRWARDAVTFVESITDDTYGLTGYKSRPPRGSQQSNSARYKLGRFDASKHWLPTQAPTAMACAARLMLGYSPADVRIKRALTQMMKDVPRGKSYDASRVDYYYWYYGTYVTMQLGGARWRTWRKALLAELLKRQEDVGSERGSWPAVSSAWGWAGGRVYCTAINAMTLGLPFRHEPHEATRKPLRR